MNAETNLLNQIRLAASSSGARLFRNNVGVAFRKNGSMVRFGLCRGSADLIGWTPKVITAGDVGCTLAVFTALEVKTPVGRCTDAQKRFLEAVLDAGGIAQVVRSVEDLDEDDTNG